MPYTTIFGDIFENEFDEEMTREFPQTYKVLKNIYPDAYKLPKDEIKTMSQMLRSQGETLDDATGLVQSHIKKNEPIWKLDYFDDKKPEQDWLNNNFNQNLNNVDYGKVNKIEPLQLKKPIHNQNPFEELKNKLIEFEDNISYPHFDKNGAYTTCTGNQDETFEEFASHPWEIRGSNHRLATPEAVRLNYDNLAKHRHPNYKVKYYKDKTNLELPLEYCDNLLDENIKTRDAELRRNIPNYDLMSQSMKNALLETHYTSNILPWKRLRDGAQRMDKDYMCGQLHRIETGRPDMINRNIWAKEQCDSGYFVK